MRLSVHYRIPLKRLRKEIDSREFALLQAYYLIRPFGDETGLLAAICALTANASGGKQDGTPFVSDDFLPGERPEREVEYELPDTEQTIADIKAALAPYRK